MREAMALYFAHLKLDLIQTQLERLKLDKQKEESRLNTMLAKIGELRESEQSIHMSIHQNGGERLEQLAAEIARLSLERERKTERSAAYKKMVDLLKFPIAKNSDDFYQNREQALQLQSKQEQQRETLNTAQFDLRHSLKKLEEEEHFFKNELASLKKRKSNIPFKILELRSKMLEALQVSENTLSFVGELIQIDEWETAWSGAIERLLHNFGLSILVPETLYGEVSHYVERTNLKERLVYFRVKPEIQRQNTDMVRKESVINKLKVKPESVFYEWLMAELANRFDYICSTTLLDFQREPKAITQNGQIKVGGQRHEKDDRHDINDASRYILGWSNAEKIRVLTQKLQAVQTEGQAKVQEILVLDQQQKVLLEKRDVCRDLLNIQDFEDINWVSVAKRIDAHQAEQKQIEANSNILSNLKEQLQKTQHLIIEREKAAHHHIALALAYQFGLEWGAIKSQSFRFVVIDEAFGRGSDESTRYGLTLFKKLNLQLLIVTPLQKIHIIENYVRSIHFVHNVEGRDSCVRNLTIKEYRQEKEKFVTGVLENDYS